MYPDCVVVETIYLGVQNVLAVEVRKRSYTVPCIVMWILPVSVTFWCSGMMHSAVWCSEMASRCTTPWRDVTSPSASSNLMSRPDAEVTCIFAGWFDFAVGTLLRIQFLERWVNAGELPEVWRGFKWSVYRRGTSILSDCAQMSAMLLSYRFIHDIKRNDRISVFFAVVFIVEKFCCKFIAVWFAAALPLRSTTLGPKLWLRCGVPKELFPRRGRVTESANGLRHVFSAFSDWFCCIIIVASGTSELE